MSTDITMLEHQLHTLLHQNTYEDCSKEIHRLKEKIKHVRKRKGKIDNRTGKRGKSK